MFTLPYLQLGRFFSRRIKPERGSQAALIDPKPIS